MSVQELEEWLMKSEQPSLRSTARRSTPVVRQSVLRVVAVLVSIFRVLIPHVLTVGALTALCLAAFTVSLALGFVAIGLGLFVLEWRVSDE